MRSSCRNRALRYPAMAPWVLAACCLLPATPRAAELLVGEGAPFPSLGAAAAAARPGDRVHILPGTYYDCAVWRADGIIVEGSGEETRITDRICEGKAVFVVAGNGVTIQRLVIARARGLESPAAAIRLEGRDLTLRSVLIEDNQDGILAPGFAGGTLRIEDSVFRANGAAAAEVSTGALRAGPLDRLLLGNTVFEAGRGESAIFSAARVTEIRGGHIEALAEGWGQTLRAEGGLFLQGARIGAGPGPRGLHAAVQVLPGDEDGAIVLRGNRLEGAGTLLLNWSGREAVLTGNAVGPDGREASSEGAWMNRMRRLGRRILEALHLAYREARALASALRRRLADV